MMIRLPLFAALALACLAGPAWAGEVRVVESEPSLSLDPPPMPAWKAASLPDAQRSHLRLPAPDGRLVAELVARNGRAQGAPQIGINRANDVAPSPLLNWHAVPGGRVARVEVASSGALGLRTALKMDALPDGLQLALVVQVRVDQPRGPPRPHRRQTGELARDGRGPLTGAGGNKLQDPATTRRNGPEGRPQLRHFAGEIDHARIANTRPFRFLAHPCGHA